MSQWKASSTLHYLNYGLSLVLMVVGAKLLINVPFDKIIPTGAALLVTALLIGGSMLVSVVKTRTLPKEISAAVVPFSVFIPSGFHSALRYATTHFLLYYAAISIA